MKDGKRSPGWIVVNTAAEDEEPRLMKCMNPTDEQYLAAGWKNVEPPPEEPPAELPPPVYRFSKYKIKQLLGPEGWALKKQELVDADLWDDFVIADCLATDDPLFGPIWEELSEEERALLVSECLFED